jgi:glucan phosphoethanolaminetransferase (alkaline phosphatase superfamily)
MASIYIALFFNSVDAIRRFTVYKANHESDLGLIGLELLLVLSATAGFFCPVRLARRVISKSVVAVVMIFSAVSASYMAFFNVAIGFGIVQATLATDIDLSKEAVVGGVIAFVLALGVLPAMVAVMTGLTGWGIGWQGHDACRVQLIVYFRRFCLSILSAKHRRASATPVGQFAGSGWPFMRAEQLGHRAWNAGMEQIRKCGPA